MTKRRNLHWVGDSTVSHSRKEWKQVMPKMNKVAEMPAKSAGAVPTAILERRAMYDGFINGLTAGEVAQFEPDEDEKIREIMVSLGRAAIRCGKEVVTSKDAKFAYVRLATPEEASAKVKIRNKAKADAAKDKAKENGAKTPVAVG